MTRTAWIDVMGIPPCYIDAAFDHDAQRVYVDAPTLATMRAAFIDAELVPADAMAATVAALDAIKPDWAGRYDVTDAGGDYTLWLAMRLDEPEDA